MNAAASRSRTSLLFSRPLLAIMLATGTMASWPIIDGSNAPVLAQASVSVEFRTALQPYGRWERHSHWGQVWVPENRPRGWRPYTVGHWAYTDDWGWYWVSDQVEDDWGWIVYHYGHWAFDGDLGWIWVPGDEWGPGWVAWRRGAEYIGWAPLAPDADVEVIDQPNVWVFVRKHDFVAPRIADVIVPEREFANVIRDTVVVNRTVNLRDRRFAVNPGIEPGIIAAAVGRPIHSFDVRPRVLAGTARIPGATEVRADQLGRAQERGQFRASVQQTQREIRPAANVGAPQPLGRGEQGRLGNNPPRLATQQGERGQPPATQGRVPQQGQAGERQQGAPGRENAQQPPARPGTQGLNPREQRGQNPQTARPQEQRQPQGQPERQPPSTQGLNPREQRGQNPQAARPQEQRQPQAQPQGQPPSTQGLNPREQRGPNPQAARPQPQPQPQAQPQRQPPSTQGLAPREQRAPSPQAARPQPQPQLQREPQAQPPQAQRAPQAQPQPRTEGRGPGGGAPGGGQPQGRGGDNRRQP